MAQARTAPSPSASRVHVVAPAPLGTTAIAALRARGIDARPLREVGEQLDDLDGVIAWAFDTPPAPATTLELARTCARAAADGLPVCVLAPAPRGSDRTAIERTAALAYLRAHGAAVTHDVDAWLEAVVLLVRFGVPAGPRVTVVAPEGSWLLAQVTALVTDAEAASQRAPVEEAGEPCHVVLYDPALGTPAAVTPALRIPVIARGELATAEPAVVQPALFGMRAAIGAVEILGRAAERIAVGLGPAPRAATAELGIDRERLARQLDRLATFERVGDHEAKVLLAAYGIPITRQAVALTPSAAVNLARRAGYPVQIKPWGNDLPTEPAGCPVERDVASDAQVRQAFASVLAAAGKLGNTAPTAVIVRETPAPNREVSVALVELPALGWTVVLDAPGAQLAAAPAPLRLVDAEALAAQVVASRASDPEPDRAGLADLLRRASHLVIDLPQLARLELPRVIVGGRAARTIVVDAAAELR